MEGMGFNIDGAKDCHLRLGLPTTLTAMGLKASEEQISQLSTAGTRSGGFEGYFTLERVQVSGRQNCPSGFPFLSRFLPFCKESRKLILHNRLAIIPKFRPF